jgi:hypothetical protein
MKRLLLVALVAAAMPASAASWLTGEQLVKLLANADPASVAWTDDSPFRTRAIAAQYLDMSNGEFVRGYIQAVHDATEGRDWCAGKQVKPLPHELADDARRALQRMPAAQLKLNAAELITHAWRQKWPCRSGQRSAP